MVDFLDVHSVSGAIRDAVAPVFLLTGIGSFLNVLVSRLARAIDRARWVNDKPKEQRKSFMIELKITVKRIKWLRRAIALSVLAALSVCLSIVSLFVSVETGLKVPHVVLITFIFSMLTVIVALACFLREIYLTSREVIVESSTWVD